MKRLLNITLAAIFLLVMPLIARSQVSYESTIEQTITDNNLVVSLYIQSTGNTSFAIGTARFTIDLNSIALDIDNATMTQTGILGDGGRDYRAQTFISGFADGWIGTDIRIKPGNRRGIIVPATKTLVATFIIPIIDPNANSDVVWRLAPLTFHTEVSQAVRGPHHPFKIPNLITDNGSFVNPVVFPLPVELVYFHANAMDRNAVLTWATASEKDNSHFDIERSGDGSGWNTVGTVAGNGSSTLKHEYEFTDRNVFYGDGISAYYYRLHQVDFNGESDYSTIRVVNYLGEATGASIILAPNPAQYNSELIVMGYDGLFTATFVSPIAKETYTFEGNGGTLCIPVGQLHAGTYLVRVTARSGELLGVQRLIVVK